MSSGLNRNGRNRVSLRRNLSKSGIGDVWFDVRLSHRQQQLLVAAGPTWTHHHLIISRAETCLGETNAEAVRLLKTHLSVTNLWTDV